MFQNNVDNYMNSMYQQPQYNPYNRLQQMEQQQYQQQQQQYQQQQPQQPKPLEIPFVGGVDGAKSVQIPNGSSVILMDNTDPIFYMVQVDQAGMRNIRGYQFQEIELKQQPAQQIDTSKFATKEDLNILLEEIKSLKGGVVNNG